MRLKLSETSTGPRAIRIAAALSLACALAACQSARFDSGYGAPPPRAATPAASDLEPDIGTGLGGRVETSPLPPAPGAVTAPDPALSQGQPPGSATVAGLPPQAAPTTPAAPPPATRSSAVGRWTAKEAAGSCSVTLSSTPALDLYRASTSGCSSKDLQSVNAWEFRDGEIYLYARGGVVARLRDAGGQFNGVLAKSGAPLTLSK
ncbi:AprI/Inh family metalloprotease inhibitor [Camelimonas abortus]|uniref:AprI/Inh family metalloprotease inhibitor n=1 Tax=Camelimonas abortus TaxID=1017184 RepID=A0ABV7LD33_9HYPH